MKNLRTVLFALLLLGSFAGAASAQGTIGAGLHAGPARAAVDFGVFYDNLAPYGNWIQRPHYGWVWTPRGVAANWHPYQAGHWVWSDQGWTWLSDEPFGWATYHYGRWYDDPQIGWAWVPGNQWGPAWVSWQEGHDSVGWAPLPPGANVTNADYVADNNPGDGAYGQNNGPNNGPNNGQGNGPGYGPNNGPGYGPNNGPGYVPDNGPGYGPDNGPAYGPAYGPDNGPGPGPAYGPDDSYGYETGYGYDNSYAYAGGYGGYAFGIAPAAYLFVPTRFFLSLDLFGFFEPWGGIFRYTHNCTSYGFYNGGFFNRGIAFDHVQRFYGHVPRYQLSELGGRGGQGFAHRIEGNRIAFYRPQIQGGRGVSPLERPAARGSVVSANQFRSENPGRAGVGQWNGQRGGDRIGQRQSFPEQGQRQQGRAGWPVQKRYDLGTSYDTRAYGSNNGARGYDQRSYQQAPQQQYRGQQYRSQGQEYRGQQNRGQEYRGQQSRGQQYRGQSSRAPQSRSSQPSRSSQHSSGHGSDKRHK
jgi:hypothetical protein